MTQKLLISQGIIVEGKYDKIKLEGIIDGLIIATGGFGIFRDTVRKNYLKKIADERGLLIITDSDSAGFIIRNHLKSFIDDSKIFNAYIPPIPGKEPRKALPSKEGTLGVEGLDRDIIIKAIMNSGISPSPSAERAKIYTPTDLFNLGLTGQADSRKKKLQFLKALGLPEHISNTALVKYMNTADENFIKKAVSDINA